MPTELTFTEQERSTALDQINESTGHKIFDLRGKAIDLQCRLNRAELLLDRTTRSPKPGERYPLWKAIQDFLTALREERSAPAPEGKDEM